MVPLMACLPSSSVVPAITGARPIPTTTITVANHVSTFGIVCPSSGLGLSRLGSDLGTTYIISSSSVSGLMVTRDASWRRVKIFETLYTAAFVARLAVVRKNYRGMVRRPSSQGDSHDVNRHGWDGPRHVAALEAGAGVLAAEPASAEAAAGYLAPRTYEDALRCSVEPTLSGDAAACQGTT